MSYWPYAHPTEPAGEHLTGAIAILQAGNLIGQRRVGGADLLLLASANTLSSAGDGQVITPGRPGHGCHWSAPGRPG